MMCQFLAVLLVATSLPLAAPASFLQIHSEVFKDAETTDEKWQRKSSRHDYIRKYGQLRHDENAYQLTVQLRNDTAMEEYIRRLLLAYGKVANDEPSLKGLVPWFSGTKDTQSLTRLKNELFEKPWVVDVSDRPGEASPMSKDSAPEQTNAALSALSTGVAIHRQANETATSHANVDKLAKDTNAALSETAPERKVPGQALNKAVQSSSIMLQEEARDIGNAVTAAEHGTQVLGQALVTAEHRIADASARVLDEAVAVTGRSAKVLNQALAVAEHGIVDASARVLQAVSESPAHAADHAITNVSARVLKAVGHAFGAADHVITNLSAQVRGRLMDRVHEQEEASAAEPEVKMAAATAKDVDIGKPKKATKERHESMRNVPANKSPRKPKVQRVASVEMRQHAPLSQVSYTHAGGSWLHEQGPGRTAENQIQANAKVEPRDAVEEEAISNATQEFRTKAKEEARNGERSKAKEEATMKDQTKAEVETVLAAEENAKAKSEKTTKTEMFRVASEDALFNAEQEAPSKAEEDVKLATAENVKVEPKEEAKTEARTTALEEAALKALEEVVPTAATDVNIITEENAKTHEEDEKNAKPEEEEQVKLPLEAERANRSERAKEAFSNERNERTREITPFSKKGNEELNFGIEALLDSQSQIATNIASKIMELTAKVGGTETSSRKTLNEKRDAYQRQLTEQHTNTTKLREKNEFIEEDINVLVRSNAQHRRQAEDLRQQSLALREQVMAAESNLTLAQDFAAKALAVDSKDELQFLEGLKRNESELSKAQAHSQALSTFGRTGPMALLQYQNDVETVNLVHALQTTLTELSVQENSSIQALDLQFQQAFTHEAMIQESLLAEQRTLLAKQKQQVDLSWKLTHAVEHAEKLKSFLNKRLTSLRSYAMLLSRQ